MKKTLIIAVAMALIVGATAYAATVKYRVERGDTWQTIADKKGVSLEQLMEVNNPSRGTRINVPVVTVPTPTPTPEPTPEPEPTPTPEPTNEIRFNAFVTAYTYWDNTPPGSADIALPVIHNKADGTGTYADPITMAVGHVITNGKSTPDYTAGTLFYMPYLQRYFIVEDVCGDGSKPQNGPCHTGYPSNAKAWLDIWIDGQDGSKSSSNNCAYAITDVHAVIQNPAPNYKVVAGPVYDGGCSAQFGETPIVN
jgi:LysM repeat protein